MRLKLFLLSLLITFFSNSLYGEENNNSKNLNLENNIQKTFGNKNLGKVFIHVVKKGDTLSSISKKYSIKKELIIQANKLLDENYIYIGQNLKIVENLFSEDKNDNFNQALFHEIKKGENLTEIANKYNLKLSQLVEINNIDNQDILIVGTKLKLTEDVYVKEETPIISLKNQTDPDKLLKKNRYGPLLISSERTNIQKRKKLLDVTHENGKRLILKLNCNKKEINVRGIGRKWKGWMPARETFENELLNDFC